MFGHAASAREKLADVTWLKDVAPSTELLKWFDHHPERWKEFRARYAGELYRNPETMEKLRAMCARGPITLLYAASDMEHNQALVLAEYLGALQQAAQQAAHHKVMVISQGNTISQTAVNVAPSVPKKPS